MDKYYVDYDEVDKTWWVMLNEGGYEHGAYYDIGVAETSLKEYAEAIAKALNAYDR